MHSPPLRARKCSPHIPPGCNYRPVQRVGQPCCTSAACCEGSVPPETACKVGRRAALARTAPRANIERLAPAMGKACPQPPARRETA
eukprot:6193739-Pleurochrysis_carterae.AAC.1